MSWLQKLLPPKIQRTGGGAKKVPEGLWTKYAAHRAAQAKPQIDEDRAREDVQRQRREPRRHDSTERHADEGSGEGFGAVGKRTRDDREQCGRRGAREDP